MEHLKIFDEIFETKKREIIDSFKIKQKRGVINFSKLKIELLVFIIGRVYGIPYHYLKHKKANSTLHSAAYIDEASGMFYFFLNDRLKFSIDSICKMVKASDTYVKKCMSEVKKSSDKNTTERFRYLSEKLDSIEF